MSDPADPVHTAGRWLVTTASGTTRLIESTGPDGTVAATRVTAGPAGDDPRYPLGTLHRDDQPLIVTGLQHLIGTTMTHGVVVDEDMYLYLEPLDPAAGLTLWRTTPVVAIAWNPPGLRAGRSPRVGDRAGP